MDMIVHQAVSLESDPVMRQELRQQVQVEAPIFVAKEDRLPVIPALRDVMRGSWNNPALRPWHQQLSAVKPQLLSVPEVFDPFLGPFLGLTRPFSLLLSPRAESVS